MQRRKQWFSESCSLCLMFFICCVSFFVRGLPHKRGVCILNISYRINHFNAKWRVKYLVLFVVGAASLRPSRCKQNSRDIFYSALIFGVSSKFLQKAFSTELCILLVISTWIFCSQCLMFLICCVLFFVRGLPHKKGVCILDISYRINHFNSKWRVKYLVLFVVGAASLRSFRSKQNSRDISFSAFLEFPPNFCKKRL